MKRIVSLCVFVWAFSGLKAQYVYTIKADSVKLTNCDSSELIIENHTQCVRGFLFNTGNGRTIFKRGLQKLNDSLYVIGADTLKTPVHAWVQGGNTFGTTGILGTLDSNNLDIYTNKVLRARFSPKGELLIGTTFNPSNAQLLVNGVAQFGNGTKLDVGDIYTAGRLFSVGTLELQGNAPINPQIYMHNEVGSSFTGNTVVSMGTGTSTLSNPHQDILEITGSGGLPIAAFRTSGRVLLGGTVDDDVHVLQVNGGMLIKGDSHLSDSVTLGKVLTGSVSDSVLVINSATHAIHKVAQSSLAFNGVLNSSLAVNGAITAQKLTLSGHDWPDYVFDSSYHLPTPDSLRQYIKQNKHLPEAPTAVEADQQGVDVGDNQKLLLKKIEELTLYMLKQEGRIQILERQIQQQNKTIGKLKTTR